jgi:glycosyltransferase involved in cell wall biosynthesis
MISGKVKILLVLPTHKFDIFIQGLIRNSSEEFEFSAILFEAPTNRELNSKVSDYQEAFSLGELNPHTLIKNFYLCRKIIKKVKPDVVHVTTYLSGIAIMLCLFSMKQKPKFLWNRHYNKGHHNLTSKVHVLLDRVLTLRSDISVVISHAQMETLVYAEKSESSKIHIVNNGIDFNLLKISAEGRNFYRNLFRSSESDLVLIAVGRLHPEKDYLTLFNALVLFQQTGCNFHLYIAGDGDSEYRTFLEMEVFRLGLVRSITFLGWVQEIHSAMLESDLFVQASLDEAFGLSILEAAALGISVATTTPGGVVEITSGFHPYIAPGDAVGLARLIGQKRLETPETRALISANVIENFSIIDMAKKYNLLYLALKSGKL